MWVLRIRWKIIYQLFVCSRQDHDWTQFYAIHVGDNNNYFCRRCLTERPSMRGGTDVTPLGTRRWYQYITEDGTPLTERIISGSNIPGDILGR